MGRTVKIAILLTGLALLGCQKPDGLPKASLSVADALSAASDSGYARALEPRPFSFPADHGPHPEFRTEWWYYTGNLETAEGRRFGFQLTFFRSALASTMPARESAWATRQAWMAHFTVTDVQNGTFRSFERWGRGALGLAGAQAEPFRVWLKDWAAAGDPMHLRASGEDVEIDLTLQQGKPPVLQGDRGLSRKGPEPGNASYYYSLPRMPAAGTVRIGNGRFAVNGLAWMDREWSTSSLSRDQVGWDWFSLQLADGRDLMLYRLRKKGGATDPLSSGTLIGPTGESRPLHAADFEIEDLGEWRSPRSGARYPARWRLRVPSAGLDLTVRPVLADQELSVSFLYWEGAVDVEGTDSRQTAKGRGYVELTGYTDEVRTPAARR